MQEIDKVDIKQAIELLEYLQLRMQAKPSDGIIGLGSIDYKVAEECANLYLRGYGKYIIFTGNCGKGTKGIITQTEAENFTNIAIQKGVPKEVIYLEKNATNTYENYLYSDDLIKRNSLEDKSLIVLGKPYQERRSYAISRKFFENRKVYITSPTITKNGLVEYYKDNQNTNLFDIISEIVAEIYIIENAPKLHLQIYQEVPENIKSIYKKMIEKGFNKYILKPQDIKEVVLKIESKVGKL